MKIGIDGRLYFETGVGVYIRNLISSVAKIAPAEWKWVVYVCPENSSRIILPDSRWEKRIVKARWHSIAEQTLFYHALMKDSLDLMHFTYFSYPIWYRRPFIATIHDLTPLICKTGKASTLPNYLYRVKLMALHFVMTQQISHAKYIITPTQTVKNQLINIFGASHKDTTHVLYEGLSFEFQNALFVKTFAMQLPQQYILYVGNFYPHKNVERLIAGYLHSQRTHHLVLLGPKNYFSQRIQSRIEGHKTIHIFHPSSIDEINTAYKNADVLVNPSLSEGFGLPLVEATSYQLPIIASNIEVFTELLGNSFYSFDPTSVRSIDTAISYFESESIPKKPILSVHCSFDLMAKQYIDLMKSFFRENHP